MKISYRFCLNDHFTYIDDQNYKQNPVIGICMKENCKQKRFVCDECINQDHLDHKQMITTFQNLGQRISSNFGDTFLDINDFFDQICQQREFTVLKKSINEEIQEIETQFNQTQQQIKDLFDACQIISKIKDGHILEINILQNPKIISQQSLYSNLTILRDQSCLIIKRMKEVQSFLNSPLNNNGNLDFSNFVNQNIRQKIISQFYTSNLLDYSQVPHEYLKIKGSNILKIENKVESKSENKNEIYYGEVNEKQMKHGRGMQIIKNGDIIYEGIWEQDQLLWGQKTTFNEDSECCIYQGKMNNKKLNGPGIKKSSFEYQLKGNFKEDRLFGFGSRTAIQGDQYKGEFYDNKKHGQGELKTQSGEKYEGQFVNDKKQGQGVYYFLNGDIYEGSFIDDQIHGKGQLKCLNSGEIYTGEFKHKKKEGLFEVENQHGQIKKLVFKNDQQVGHFKSIIKKSAQVIKGSLFDK